MKIRHIMLLILIVSTLFSNGYAEDDISVNIYLDKEYVAIGEEVTAYYQISGGSGEYSIIHTSWQVDREDGSGYSGLGYEEHEGNRGSARFTPMFGAELSCCVHVEDSTGVPISVWSNSIKILGEAVEPEVTIELDKEYVAIGEEVTAYYQISGGSGEYPIIHTSWQVDREDGSGYSGLGYEEHEENTGIARFAPRFGAELSCCVHVEDSSGVPVSAWSKEIKIIEKIEYDVELPMSLTRIEDGAFIRNEFYAVKCPEGLMSIGELSFADNDNLRYIYIPHTVDYIASNAFSGCSENLTIITSSESFAAKFAERMGFTVINIDM